MIVRWVGGVNVIIWVILVFVVVYYEIICEWILEFKNNSKM